MRLIRNFIQVASEYEFCSGDVAMNFNKKLCVLKVYESYDLGLDIVFHSDEKVKTVLLCVFRVVCRDAIYWLGITTDIFVITARFCADFSSAYGIGIVIYLDAKVLTNG